MKMITSKHQSSRLQIILLQIILAAMIVGTILAFLVVVVITQQEANAATASTTFTFDQYQTNKCNGFSGCSNTGTIALGLGHGPNHQ
jgi:flagellar basal body-associated protein FliL